MPHIIAVEYSEAQSRQIAETIAALAKNNRPLSAKYDAENFPSDLYSSDSHSHFSWQDLFSTVIQPGLFAQQESIVVYNADALGPFPEKLAHLIEDNNADCSMILAANSPDLTKFLKPILNLITIIKPEAQVPPWKRKDWLLDLAQAQKIKLSHDAASLLAENIDSQEELRSELLKLATYAGKREISTVDVEALSFDDGGRALMKFIDGICDNKPRDVSGAIRFLKRDSILLVLAAITNRLRPAMIMSCVPEKLQTEALKAIDHDSAKKKYAVTKSRNALKNYGEECIKRFMLKAARLSFLEKTNRAEGWEGFELIVWELMAKTKHDSEGGIF